MSGKPDNDWGECAQGGEMSHGGKMDKIRDGNHTIRYNLLVVRRLYRGHIRGEGDNIFAALSDITNSLMRAILGLGVVSFTISANLCKQLKKKCHRRANEERR